MYRVTRHSGVWLIALALTLTACSSPKPPSAPASAGDILEGTIRVSGAWALYPMMVRWGEEFQKMHPKVRVDISAGGAGKGVTDALGKLVDLGMISREIKPEEVQQGGAFVPVAKDAVFAVVHADNPALANLLARGVPKQAFVDLWIGGKSLTWGEVAQSSVSDLVQIYTRSDACGAAEAWAKYLGGAQEDLQGTGVYGDPGLAEAVKNDRLGIGYNNLNYAYDLKTGRPLQGLQVLPIDSNGNGKVDSEEDLTTKAQAIAAIVSGAYPSPPARDLYLLTKGSFQGLTREFVHWILTDGQQYLDEVGYIAPTPSQIQQALGMLGF
jgi:phosphate transport system substrate-binding protein